MGKVMLLMDQATSCNTGSSSNHNLMAIFEIFEYDIDSNVYISASRSGLLKVSSIVWTSDEFVKNNGRSAFKKLNNFN